MDFGFELLCMSLIALLFGMAATFFGYRLFLILLPIWGFFFGFGLGAQTIQVLLGTEFLGTITSWVVGFIVGALFAVLSYLFYIAAVAIISFSAGYALTVGGLEWVGLDWGLIVWLIALIVGVIVALAVIRFNIQKYAIIVITAIGGTAAIIYTLLASFGGLKPLDLFRNPVQNAISDSIWWLLFFVIVAAAGIFVQLKANPEYEIEEYDRMAAA